MAFYFNTPGLSSLGGKLHIFCRFKNVSAMPSNANFHNLPDESDPRVNGRMVVQLDKTI